VISPRITRLLRTPDARAFQRAVASAVPPGLDARGTAVLVPSASAAEALRRTLEDLIATSPGDAVVLPDLVTRTGFYVRLHASMPDAPALLTEHEREVLLRLAVEDARAAGVEAPFRLRPGLLTAMLAFYDELRRRLRTIDSFDRHLRARLEPGSDSDRGAARLLAQTTFLAAALAAFERRVADSGNIDEHALRALLLASPPGAAYRHVIVTVADQAADALGLWPADFDLLARLPGLDRIDVVATERILAAGLYERLHEALPGIDEVRVEGSPDPPGLLVPARAPASEPSAFFVTRDREEEAVAAARWIKMRAQDAGPAPPPLDSLAVVFARPLPYLYLARQVFESARVPYQTFDALPLAAEPYAAALDLVFTVATEEATRAALVDLLGSPHWALAEPDRRPGRDAIAALDAMLIDAKYLGGWDALAQVASTSGRIAATTHRAAARARMASGALAVARKVVDELRAWHEVPTASGQIAAILRFITTCERLPRGDDPGRERHLRARGAIIGALEGLREAHRRYDDRAMPLGELVATVRRWIERQTFTPRAGVDGVLLLDAAAAPYADVDAIRIVGVVESDWPDRTPAGVFYPAALLRDLGWPPESERLAAARARFQDLLGLAREEVSVSVFLLEDDSLVMPSPFLEDVVGAGLVSRQAPGEPFPRMLAHEGLMLDPPATEALPEGAATWLELRQARTDGLDWRYRGRVGARPPEAYAVSRVERYLECPFKYFAGRVLRLEEEREDESGLTPQERGQLLHGIFEAFFREWQARGEGAVTAATIDRAVALFTEVAEAGLANLPAADRALERTYLLGSAVSPGLAERAFACEIEHGIDVAERLLEYPFDGPFVFDGPDGPRTVHVRGKADRIDRLVDGSLRVVDYKLGRAPRAGRALQLPVYAVCASQHLAGPAGDPRPVRFAGYVAFREKHAFVDVAGRSGDLAATLRDGQHRFLDAVHGIEAGNFLVQPDEPWMCTRCGFSPVCRKDYVGDE
jgi:RecB family exonuclease